MVKNLKVIEFATWVFAGVTTLISGATNRFTYGAIWAVLLLRIGFDIYQECKKSKPKLTTEQIIDLLIADNQHLRKENEAMRAEMGKEVYEP